MKPLRNEKGSAIVWAMITAVVLLLLCAAVLSISYNYSHRSMNNNLDRQLYFTARSGVDLIVNEFVNDGKNKTEIYKYLEKNKTWSVDDIGLQNNMGKCSLDVELVLPQNETTMMRTLLITAKAEKNGHSRTILATLIGNITIIEEIPGVGGNPGSPKEEIITWGLASYTDKN